ncbi:hypothetical protein [Polaribacter sp. Z022]|uniref:hypothetical protein n=1 Tax=Polaribacter sp. Z022 TaxID=2927125 RepID=UPI0020204E19|nr:hypothetical protein [Polaribacter sp. Z022]MCL7755016.1 hypothetical protein [Polaribacter sp. Z022]
MANKLYVFGIGGTGSRVIKALTMLLASGVKLDDNFDMVVPIIIDPDTANGDLNRTADILMKYQNIVNKSGEDNSLFGTKIKTLTQLTNENLPNLSNNFKFSIDGSGQKFGESIDYNGLDDENKALINLLFSKENIEADMTVGFKGNPNIGSVVLNKIVDSQEYHEFSNSFNEGDAIFIISSIFGGTGASGFPLLLKNLRTNDSSRLNSDKISRAAIGAISYLPYFKVSDNNNNEKEIDSTTFFGKAKAALSYYEHAIFNNNSLDVFYHIGDKANNNMKYAEGKGAQKNDAHFVELAGALAILDFVKNIPSSTQSNITAIKEFGIEDDNGKLKFDSLGQDAKDKLKLPLSKLYLLDKFVEKSMTELLKSPGHFNGENGIKKEFYNTDFYKSEFIPFLNYYKEWVDEMKTNDVSFMPFHDNQQHDSLFDFIIGNQISKGGLLSRNKATGDILIKSAHKLIKSGELDKEEEESRFIKVFDEILEEQVNNILN